MVSILIKELTLTNISVAEPKVQAWVDKAVTTFIIITFLSLFSLFTHSNISNSQVIPNILFKKPGYSLPLLIPFIKPNFASNMTMQGNLKLVDLIDIEIEILLADKWKHQVTVH